VKRLGFLGGAHRAKEAGQGHALIGEGLTGGRMARLVRHMGILEAYGTALDWIVHPRLSKAKRRLRRTYFGTVTPSKAMEIPWNELL